MLENSTIHTFSGRLGSAFRIYEDGPSPLEVESIPATGLGGGGTQTGRGEPFLVPIGPDEEGLRYEAILVQNVSGADHPSIRSSDGLSIRR